jgi:hypothetical protein
MPSSGKSEKMIWVILAHLLSSGSSGGSVEEVAMVG